MGGLNTLDPAEMTGVANHQPHLQQQQLMLQPTTPYQTPISSRALSSLPPLDHNLHVHAEPPAVVTCLGQFQGSMVNPLSMTVGQQPAMIGGTVMGLPRSAAAAYTHMPLIPGSQT